MQDRMVEETEGKAVEGSVTTVKVSYTVTAIPKEKGKKKKVYREVYDIGHYYGRNVP